MRPSNKCGTPIGNADINCEQCRTELDVPELTNSNPDSSGSARQSNFKFVMLKLFEHSIAGMIFGAIIGGTAFGLCFGILSLPIAVSTAIAVSIGFFSALAIVVGQFT